ncbi:ABC transporter permease [Actinomyces capricornis]|uniref:ABC transporter permease n=1 Tax=Actinomyces capricornis TaxID=2755559 RepID=A0ABN6KBI1_9ACTO|nr:ABC transporter permease [Actinomyces capricornis]BDA65696.1 ABC transporter permease [Actinomyces capricornis]
MFLALREIRHEPMRFGLIIAVIALVAYLTFFLAALASGLAQSYRAAVDGWGAGSIVLTDASNESISASRLTPEQLAAAQELAEGAGTAADPLISVAAVAQASDLRDEAGDPLRVDVFAFGIDPAGALAPTVTSGSPISDPTREILVDDSLTAEGLAVGDAVTLLGSDHEWHIAGFTHDTSFQAAPVITIDDQALGCHGPDSLSPAVSAVVLGADLSENGSAADAASRADLQILSTEELIRTLPGYSAQVLTFSLMIGSLILIASLVLGIFLYVLTLHKRPILGILKARGVPTGYLIHAGGAQTTILAATGVAVGLLATAATALVLPASVPFRFSPVLNAGICAAFIVVSIIGGLISVRMVARIDPAEAIA